MTITAHSGALRQTRIRRRPKRAVAAASAVAVFSLLAACSPGGAAAGGISVPLGASMEEYQAALVDMDPVELRMTVSGSPGNPYAAPAEDYKEAIEQWSGGKISIEIGYANSFATPAETSTAMADGRISVGSITPGLEPDKFAEWAKLQRLSFMHLRTPIVGTLQAVGAMADVSWQQDALVAEFERAGLYPLVPYIPTSPLPVLTCTEPGVTSLESLSGKSARVGSAVHATEAEVVGLTPVSLPYDETYSALQRGTIQCVISGIEFLGAAGTPEVAPHMTINRDGGFTSFGSALVVGKNRYDTLPLPARQLLFDRADVLLKSTIQNIVLAATVYGLELMRDAGGGAAAFDDKAMALLAESQAAVADASDPALVAAVEKAHDEWLTTVKDLGYVDEVGILHLPGWYTPEKVDLEPFVQKVMEEVVNEHRPGA